MTIYDNSKFDLTMSNVYVAGNCIYLSLLEGFPAS